MGCHPSPLVERLVRHELRDLFPIISVCLFCCDFCLRFFSDNMEPASRKLTDHNFIMQTFDEVKCCYACGKLLRYVFVSRDAFMHFFFSLVRLIQNDRHCPGKLLSPRRCSPPPPRASVWRGNPDALFYWAFWDLDFLLKFLLFPNNFQYTNEKKAFC